MGEAKRRKSAATREGAAEGEGPKNSTSSQSLKRGLVVSPPLEINGTSLYAKSSQLDPQELRCATLLWDKIVWPSSRALHFASGPDEQFLEQEGFLTRPDYTVNGDVAQGIAYGQIAAFNDLDRKEPGVWSLAQGENSFLLKGGSLAQAGNAQLHLTNAIPVPNQDVPLAEVLDFKLKRRDELQALRQEIDTLIASLNLADDKEQELKKLISEVDKACADAIRVGSEWRFPVRLTNFKTTYKLRPVQTLAGVVTGVFGSQAVALTASQAALAGLAGAAIATAPALELSFDGFEWRGLKPRHGPYRYVYEFRQKLF